MQGPRSPEPNHVWLFDDEPDSRALARDILGFNGDSVTSLLAMISYGREAGK